MGCQARTLPGSVSQTSAPPPELPDTCAEPPWASAITCAIASPSPAPPSVRASEDRSKVVAVGLEVRTPAGTFSDCVRTKDFAPLDNATEHKLYCPGVGLVREEAPGVRVELVRYD